MALKSIKTQQQFKDRCDINKIIQRYTRTGVLSVSSSVPQYGNFTGIGDFQSVQNRVKQAELEFMRLSASVRARFNHSVGDLIDFMIDASKDWKSDKAEEGRKLGLLPALTKEQMDEINRAAAPAAGATAPNGAE